MAGTAVKRIEMDGHGPGGGCRRAGVALHRDSIAAGRAMRGAGPRQAGMTLIEVLIAVALLGVLLAIALPSYRQYVLRGYRVAAIELMLDMARCQERVYATDFRYDTTQCLLTDSSGRYQLGYEPVDTSGLLQFAVQAEPLGTQQQDPCGTLVLNHTGARTIGGPAERLRQCWEGR